MKSHYEQAMQIARKSAEVDLRALVHRLIPIIFRMNISIDWFKRNITGNSHISWEDLWFPGDFPLSQPTEHLAMNWGHR